MPGAEADEATIFLATTLIHEASQADVVKVMQSEQGSDHDRVWDSNEESEK